MSIEPYVVAAGENFYTIADRVAPDADRDTAAEYLWRVAGFPGTIWEDQILWRDTDAPELAAVAEEPPAEEPTAATWLEVDPGPGSMSGQRRVIVTTDEQYPNATGVTFSVNGTVNRTDPTGRRENSEFHTYPPVTLAAGDVLRAEWTDVAGVDRVAEYTVPGEPPVEEPPAEPVDDAAQPTAENTGPTGALAPHSGTIVATSGQVIENLDITGKIVVHADNVTIRNCRLFARGHQWGIELSGCNNTLIEDCEIDFGDVASNTQASDAIHLDQGDLPSNVTVRRCNIRRGRRGISGSCNGLLVEYCYLWDNWFADGSHSTRSSMEGGGGFVYRFNSFEMPNPGASACLALYGRNPIDDVLIHHNWFAGGSYCVNIGIGSSKAYDPTNVRVTDNLFRTVFRPKAGTYGWFQNAGNSTRTGNVWADGPLAGLPEDG